MLSHEPDLYQECQHALKPAAVVVIEKYTGTNVRILKELQACMQALRGLVRITPTSIRVLPRHDTRPVARLAAAYASMGKSGKERSRCRTCIDCVSPGQRYLTCIFCRYLQDSRQESSRGPRWRRDDKVTFASTAARRASERILPHSRNVILLRPAISVQGHLVRDQGESAPLPPTCTH